MAMLMHVSLTAGLLMLNPIAISGANLLVFSFARIGRRGGGRRCRDRCM